MPDLGSATFQLAVNAARFRTGLATASRDAHTFAGRMQRSFLSAGHSMQNLGRTMTLFVTGPLALFAKSSIDVLGEFQDTMQKTAGIAEIGVDRMGRALKGAELQRQIDRVGRDVTQMGLRFGIAARDMAEGLYFISSAGFRAQQSMKILRQVSMSAAGGLGEVEDVGLAVVGALNAYNLQARDAAKITDTMSMAVRKGVMEADALAKVVGVVMGPARDAKVEFDEVAGAIALMTRSSIPAARAATSLRSVLMRFEDPTEEVSKALKKMGLNAADVRDMMGRDFIGTMFTLQKGLQSTGIRAAELFDSIRALPGFTALTASAQDANEVMGATQRAFDQTGVAARQNERSFNIMSKSLGFVKRRFEAVMEAVRIELGGVLEPMVRRFQGRLTAVGEAFLGLSDAAQSNIVKMAGLAAAIGPVVFIVGTLIKMFGSLGLAGGLMGPAMLLVVGLGAAFGTAAAQSQQFRDRLMSLWNVIERQGRRAYEALSDLFGEIAEKTTELATRVYPRVKELIRTVGNLFVTFIRESKPFISVLIDAGKTVLPTVLTVLSSILRVIRTVVTGIGGANLARLTVFVGAWWGLAKAITASRTAMTGFARWRANTASFMTLGALPNYDTRLAAASSSATLLGGTSTMGRGNPLAMGAFSGPAAAALARRNQLAGATMGRNGTFAVPGTQGRVSGSAYNAMYRQAQSNLAAQIRAGGGTFAAARGAGVGGRFLAQGAMAGISGALSSIFSPLTIAVVGLTSALSAAADKAEYFSTYRERSRADLDAILSGQTTISAMRSQIERGFSESNILRGATRNEALSGTATTGMSFWEQASEIAFNPMQSLFGKTGRQTQWLEATRQAEVLRKAVKRVRDELMETGGPAFKTFLGDIMGGIRSGQVGLDQALGIAELTRTYENLKGSLNGVSRAAIEMYLDAGMVEQAQALLAREVDRATRAFIKQADKVVESKAVFKAWIDVITNANLLTRGEKMQTFGLLEFLEQSGGKLSRVDRQQLQAAIGTGNFGMVRAILIEAIADVKEPVEDFGEYLKGLPQRLQKWIRIAMAARKFPAGQGWESTRPGRRGRRDRLSEMSWGNERPRNVMDAEGNVVPNPDYRPGRGARAWDTIKRSIVALNRAVGDGSKKLNEREKAALRVAIKDRDWQKALRVLHEQVMDDKKATESWRHFLDTQMSKPVKVQFFALLDQARKDTDAWFADLSTREVNVQVRARSGGGRGHAQQRHSGGWITGGTKSDVPAILQEGEFVVNRGASQRFAPLLEQVNKYHEGGRVTANVDLSHVAKTIRRGLNASTTGLAGLGAQAGLSGAVVQIGRQLAREGYDVGEHPAFGGVAGVHTSGSWHYKNKAIDVNWPGGGAQERAKLRSAYFRLKRHPGIEELFFDGLGIPHAIGGHESHLHAAILGGGSGGGRRRGGWSWGLPGGIQVNAGVAGLRRATEGWENFPGVPTDPEGAVKLGKQMAARRGWTGGQWNALYNLWQRESGWRWNADNPSSSAYGIPQALPGSKMASAGNDWRTNPRTQIEWGLGYIAGRYGSPIHAWGHSERVGWYGDGGITTRPVVAGLGEKGREAILPLDTQTGRNALRNLIPPSQKNGSDNVVLAEIRDALQRIDDRDLVVEWEGERVATINRRKEIMRRRG